MRKIELTEELVWEQITKELHDFITKNIDIKSIYVSKELFELLLQRFNRSYLSFNKINKEYLKVSEITEIKYAMFNHTFTIRIFKEFKNNEYEYGI